MQNPTVRMIVAVLAGTAAAVITVMLVQRIGHMIWPPPEGVDFNNPDDLASMMETIPLGGKLAVVSAWFLGTLAGAITALKIGKAAWPAWAIGLLMVAASVSNTFMFPHPVWMTVSAVVLPALAVWIAQKLVPTG